MIVIFIALFTFSGCTSNNNENNENINSEASTSENEPIVDSTDGQKLIP